jgi:hypothetical protein
MVAISKTCLDIKDVALRLKARDPENAALKQAREWWKAGRFSQYSNQDHDILNGLLQELMKLKRQNESEDTTATTTPNQGRIKC